MAKASDIIRCAVLDIGVKESPPQSNRVKFNDWYYGRPVSGPDYPWCVAAVMYWANRAGVKLPIKTASCGALMRAAQAAGMWVTHDYRPGDIVIYNFPGGGRTDHCGVLESVVEGDVVAIEGNTGSGSDSDGGEVMRRFRPMKRVVGAVRPAYDPEEKEDKPMDKNELISVAGTGDNPSPWAKEATEFCKRKGIFNGDGEGNYGWQQPITREAVAQIVYNILR